MFARKPPVRASDTDYLDQLHYLYAQRFTIDTLIESLEEYDCLRDEGVADQARKSA
jgi:hypothetical protein